MFLSPRSTLKMNSPRTRLSWVGVFITCALSHAQEPDAETWRQAKDPVAMLWQQAEKDHHILQADTDAQWLKTVLDSLDIPTESQVLVFSKTSLQKSHISPTKPRALYYNEDCYIGWVQGGEMEVVAADPERGLQYYLIPKPFVKPARPRPVASNQCMSCHVGGALQMQSVHTRESGYPMGQADVFSTTYESPLSERWGGWYVTGQHGKDHHMGNVMAYTRNGHVFLDRQKGANVESLEDWVSTKPYAADTSDIVALMVLEHQYVIHNTLHDAGRTTRRVLVPLADGPQYDQVAKERILKKRAGEIVSQLLFSGEYPLKEGVSGSLAFQSAFRRNRKETLDGRSLKDFDLKTRLFKHRCSYMIYSASFKGLPLPLRKTVYQTLAEVLSGEHPEEYGYLSAKERTNIREILLETDADAQTFWKADFNAAE